MERTSTCLAKVLSQREPYSRLVRHFAEIHGIEDVTRSYCLLILINDITTLADQYSERIYRSSFGLSI